jgi:hypothetical protein
MPTPVCRGLQPKVSGENGSDTSLHTLERQLPCAARGFAFGSGLNSTPRQEWGAHRPKALTQSIRRLEAKSRCTPLRPTQHNTQGSTGRLRGLVRWENLDQIKENAHPRH